MIKYFSFSLFLLLLLTPQYVFAEGFSQEDRERLIRLETRVEEGLKSLQLQIDSMKSDTQRQIDSLSAATQRQTDSLSATTQKQIDDLSANTQKQIDDLRTLLLWGFGILFGGMGILIGFVIWDRRTALEPVLRKSRDIENTQETLLKALKEYSNVEPKLAEILRSFNLL